MRVYVAGPYTLGSPEENVARAIEAGEALLRRGYAPFVPHLNHHWHALYPHAHAEWMALDLPWLDVADAVVRLPGPSIGADIECRRARERGIPVYTAVDGLPDLTLHVVRHADPPSTEDPR